jgi:mono/diheme cytochrome c family protein
MEGVVAFGIPSVLVIVLLLLPFVDRRSARSLGKRPVARLGLVGILGASTLLFAAAVKDAPVKPPEVLRVLTSTERAGRALFLQQQCNGCHVVKGLGGREPQEEAPDLTEIGLKHSPAWLHSFIENPLVFHPESKMPIYGPPTLTHQEIEEITRYLSTLRGAGTLDREPEYVDTFPEIKKPKEKQ